MVQADVDAFVFCQRMTVADDAALRIGDDAVTARQYGMRVEVREAGRQAGKMRLAGVLPTLPACAQSLTPAEQLPGMIGGTRGRKAQAAIELDQRPAPICA